MNLSDYFRVVRKRKRIIFFSFILMILSTIYYTNKLIPVFKTSSKVKLEQRKSVAEILTELVTWSPGDEMESQAALIQSHQVMEKTAEKLNLIHPNMDPGTRMAIIRDLKGKVEATPVEYTNLISIAASSNNPGEAMDIANTVAEVYVQSHFENKIKEASNVKQFVKAQLDNYLKELEEHELALQRFKMENPLVVDRDNNNRFSQTNTLVSNLEQDIVKSELDLVSLKTKYTEAHPEVRSLSERVRKAKKDIDAKQSQLENRQKDFSSKEIQLIKLKRNIAITEDIYLMFKKKYEEARVLEAEKAQDATIVEPAPMPGGPITPNRGFNLIIGLFSGLLIGLIMAFVSESLDTTVGRIDDIEELLNVPVLGIIPDISMASEHKGFQRKFKEKLKISEKDPTHKRLVTIFEPSSVVSEAYRSLRTQLDLIEHTEKGKCIVITSAAPEEGKTQTLCNLAIVLAQSGQKVLIVGSDFRKPTIYKLFGLNRHPGLTDGLMKSVGWEKTVNTVTDMLLGGMEYERILNTPGIENIGIITCGERTPNPAELLNNPNMDKLIQEFKKQYDVILFDSPPTIPVSDSAVLGDKADGIILIYQAGKTSRHALLRTKIQLENVKAKIYGVVINHLKAQYIEDVTPYQKYRYYGYYGEKKKDSISSKTKSGVRLFIT